jgi:hypothetical protein
MNAPTARVLDFARNHKNRNPRHPLLLAFAPIENDFAGVARFHQLDGFLEFSVRKVMRDHRGNIEAALDHCRHFVPGLVHFAAVNAFDGERAEHDRVPIDGSAAGHDA